MKTRIASLIFVSAVSAVSAIACGGVEGPRSKTIEEPKIENVIETTRSGLARWSLVESNCPTGRRDAFETEGSIRVEEGTLFVELESMPELSGTIVDGHADIAGETTFQGISETITCSVQGTAAVQQDLVVSQVSETLTSRSELNCKETWNVEVTR